MIFLTTFVHQIVEDMNQNLFLNRVMSYGAILGFVMFISHIFEQCELSMAEHCLGILLWVLSIWWLQFSIYGCSIVLQRAIHLRLWLSSLM